MKKSEPREVVAEIKCPACKGTGISKAKQPVQPGRRLYPPRSAECAGKGRIALPRD